MVAEVRKALSVNEVDHFSNVSFDMLAFLTTRPRLLTSWGTWFQLERVVGWGGQLVEHFKGKLDLLKGMKGVGVGALKGAIRDPAFASRFFCRRGGTEPQAAQGGLRR